MKRFALSFFTVLFFSAAFSQKLHFIYLQAEPEQAFFAKINDKVYHSTNSGYLILSRLKDSIYTIGIGFPGNKWPEQRFTLDINSRDHGYTLKNFGEKGWGLYDIEAATTQMAIIANNSAMKTEPREVSAFTDILSKAANDPSLKEKPVVVVKEEKPAPPKEDKSAASKDEKAVALKEEKPVEVAPTVITEELKPSKDSAVPKQEESKVAQKDESAAVNNKDESPAAKAEDKPETTAQEYKHSIVTRKSESSMTDGLHLTFIDDYGNGKKDTIRITIPNQKNHLAEVKQPEKEEKKFLDIPADDSVKSAAPDQNNDTVKKVEPGQKAVKPDTLSAPVAKKKCASVATESDFFKVRKNMAAATNDEAMIAIAKKSFKTKCFSSLQIKNLGTLFLNDAARYKFFDEAYESVSDQENFPALVSELKDEYYINRFKAMLRPA